MIILKNNTLKTYAYYFITSSYLSIILIELMLFYDTMQSLLPYSGFWGEDVQYKQVVIIILPILLSCEYI